MSKGGSRYGRRSNWFKINFLLQEQQQKAVAAAQAAVAAAANSSSSTTSTMTLHGDSRSALKGSSNLGFLNNTNALYPPHLGLHQNDRSELKRSDSLSEHVKGKHALNSPTVNSPDSHNSDSMDMADRRRLLMKTASHLPFHNDIPSLSQLPFNKDLFMPFSIPDIVSAPSFLPHLLFSGYHSALLAHQQQQQQQHQHSNLVKPPVDPALFMNPVHFLANNNSRLMPNQNSNNSDNNDNINNNSYTAEELSKCYLDAVLKTQNSLNLDKKHNMLKTNDDIIDTPQQSPHSNHSKSRNSTPNHFTQPKIDSPNLPSSPVRSLSSPYASRVSSASASPSNWNNQDTPIDLSVKTPTIKNCSTNEKSMQSSKLRSFGHESAFQMLIEKT